MSNIAALYTDMYQCFCNTLCLFNVTVSGLCCDHKYFIVTFIRNTKVAARLLFGNDMNACPAYLQSVQLLMLFYNSFGCSTVVNQCEQKH